MNDTTVTLTPAELRAILEALGVAHANWSEAYHYGHLDEREERVYKNWEAVSKKLADNKVTA